MEERQIQEFIHRIAQDESLRQELVERTDEVIRRENFSPRVATIVTRLVPHLHVLSGHSLSFTENSLWWNCIP